MSHKLSLKEYLNAQSLTEDVNDEVTKIQADIAAIDAQINQRVAPLLSQKQRLQKLLVTKQKQAGTQQQQQQQQQQPTPQQQPAQQVQPPVR